MKKRTKSSPKDKPLRRSSSKQDDGKVRLQKLLAQHGHGSRRSCEEFILEGRVEVDGKVVNKLGAKVDPETQKVTLDGEKIVRQRMQYFILNKPPGVLSTSSDPSGRIRVIDLIKTNQRVYNVGRLDKSSEGLILVTNDGDLANKLTHPRFGVEKKYHVTVAGQPDREKLATLKKGIYLAEAFVQVANVRVKKKMRDRTILEIVLDEGRNREIRRILARIGHKVTELKRVAIGPLTLGELPSGSHRQLTSAEVRMLKKFVEGVRPKKATKKKRVAKTKRAAATGRGGSSTRPSAGTKSGAPRRKKKKTMFRSAGKSTKKKTTKKKTGGRGRAAVTVGAKRKRTGKKSVAKTKSGRTRSTMKSKRSR